MLYLRGWQALFTKALYVLQIQVGELTTEIEHLPSRSQLSAAYINYLGAESEDVRRSFLSKWSEITETSGFDMRRFLSSESEMLIWKGEGLPSDNLSMENALMIVKVGIVFCR